MRLCLPDSLKTRNVLTHLLFLIPDKQKAFHSYSLKVSYVLLYNNYVHFSEFRFGSRSRVRGGEPSIRPTQAGRIGNAPTRANRGRPLPPARVPPARPRRRGRQLRGHAPPLASMPLPPETAPRLGPEPRPPPFLRAQPGSHPRPRTRTHASLPSALRRPEVGR